MAFLLARDFTINLYIHIDGKKQQVDKKADWRDGACDQGWRRRYAATLKAAITAAAVRR